MQRYQIDQIFNRTFNNEVNILTPNILSRGKSGDYLYELSWGEGIFDRTKKMYGVTVLTLDGEKTNLSQGGFNLSDAYDYISELKEK